MNSLKSIYSRITSIPEAVDAMADVGVSIEDMNGGLRDVDDILGDLGGKWSSLSREQQQNLGLQIAGRYQLSRFLILMENWDQALDATDSALHSSGSAMRENEKYMDSYEAKINKVKNAWTESTMALQESFLGDAILLFTELGTGSINTFTKLIDTFGLLPGVLGVAGIALTLFKVNINDLSRKTLVGAGRGIRGFSESIYLLGLEARSQVKQIGVLRTGLQGIRSLLMSPTTILMFAGWGITKAISKIYEAKEASEELERQTNHSMEAIKNERESVDNLVSEYSRLSKIDRNNEQEERYVELQNELANILPTVKVGEDNKGNAIVANSQYIEEEIELLEKRLELERESLLLAADHTMSDGQNKKDKLVDDMQEQQDELDKLLDKRRQYVETFDDEDKFGKATVTESAGYQMISDDIDKVIDKMSGFQKDSNEIDSELRETVNAVVDSINTINSQDKGFVVDLSLGIGLESASEVEEIAKQVNQIRSRIGEDLSFDEFNYSQLQALEMITKEASHAAKEGSADWKEYGDQLETATGSMETANQIIGRLMYTEKELRQSAKENNVEFSEHKPVFEDYGKVIKWVTNEVYLNKLAMEANGDAAEENAISIETLTDRIDKAKDDFGKLSEIILDATKSGEYDLAITTAQTEAYEALSNEVAPLNKLLEDLSDGKSITAAEAMNLIAQEEELANAISFESGQVKINEQAVRELRDTKVKSYNDMLNSTQEEAMATANATISNLKNYGLQIEAIKNVQDAKRALAEISFQEALDDRFGSSRSLLGGGIVDSARRGIFNSFGKSEALEQAREEVNGVYDLLQRVEGLQGMATAGLNTVGTSAESSEKAAKKAKKANEELAKEYKLSSYRADEYALALEKVNAELERQNAISSKYPKHSKEHRDSLQKEIELLKSKSNIMKQQSDDLDRQIRSGKITQTGVVQDGSIWDTTKRKSTSSSSSSVNASAASKSVADYYLNNFKVTSPYGVRTHPITGAQKMHGGTDFANGRFGDPVKAVKSGKVITATYSKTAGNWVVVQQDDGTVAKYMHMQNGLNVKAGQHISAGQQLGKIGSSGSSTGAHLHLQIERNGATIDPMGYLKGLTSGSSSSASSSGKAKIPEKSAAQKKSEASAEEAQRLSDLDQARLNLIGQQQEIASIGDQIEELYFAIFESHLASFDHARDKLQKELAEVDYYQTRHLESSEEWAKYQAKREKLLRQQNKQQKESIKFIEQEIKSNKNLTKMQRMRLDDLLNERQSELWDMERQFLDERIKMYDKLSEVYKSALEAQKDAALSSIDKMLKEIDEKEKEADYKKALGKEQDSRQEILDEISQWSINDSDEATKRIKELTEELQKIDEAIEDMQHKKGLEDRKDALNEEKDRIGNQYDDLINDEQMFADMRSKVIKGNTKSIEKELNTFYKKLGGMTKELGNSVVKNLQNSIKQMNSYIKDPNFKGVDIPHFDTGGRARVKSPKGGIAVVHDKEHIFKPDDTENLLKTMGLTKDIFKYLKMPKTPQLATADNANKGFNYDIDLHIENMNGSQEEVNSFMDRIAANVRKRGGKM